MHKQSGDCTHDCWIAHDCPVEQLLSWLSRDQGRNAAGLIVFSEPFDHIAENDLARLLEGRGNIALATWRDRADDARLARALQAVAA